MSRRSRQSTAAVTLFSFQDIIMSTSGIMIMIVLLLSLELIQRPGSAGVETPATKMQEILDQIEAVEADIAQLGHRLDESEREIQAAAELTPPQLNAQIEALSQINSDLQAQLADLESQLRRQMQQEPAMAAARTRNAALESELKDLQQKQAELQGQLQSIVHQDRPLFTLPRGSTHKGWVVDVSSKQIQVAPIDRAARPLTFTTRSTSFLSSQSAATQFLDWARKQPGSDIYFFLLVRPQGVEAFSDISEQFDDGQISYGYDLISDDQTVLDPERGCMR